MARKITVLAFDFGASSGRAIKGTYENGTLICEEVHRFDNNPVTEDGHLCWDFPALLEQVHIGIQKAGDFDTIGFDTWGVDFGLLDENGKLLGLPVHYRDSRTNGVVEETLLKISAKELYCRTGNQILPINTLFQLLALQKENPELLSRAEHLLFIPDLFAYSLTGNMCMEETVSSTSQMLNPITRDWDYPLLEQLGIPQKLFRTPIKSGTFSGNLPDGRPLITVAGHDTQCAVAAIPLTETNRNVAFVSCGTWSLLGTELDEPILTAEGCRQGLSNELGADGKIHYLQNIIGLWLIQESRREYRRRGIEYSYADLEREALAAEPHRSLIDPNHPLFVAPGDIPGRICRYCEATGQPVPRTVGEIMRCIYESLALTYRRALGQLSLCTGRKFTAFHVLGGGAKDRLLCQMAADAMQIPVVAGPVEATALGNIMIQLHSAGAIASIEEGQALIARTQEIRSFTPGNVDGWEEAYQNYLQVLNRASGADII
ncbi:MAG: rhamnulokinase [Clostridia bacterium]|nr:rhamnulokinase [Clostridia bacterium]